MTMKKQIAIQRRAEMPFTIAWIRQNEELVGEFRYLYISEHGSCIRIKTHRPPFLAGAQHKSISSSSEVWEVQLDRDGANERNVSLGFIRDTIEIPARYLEVDWRVMLDDKPCVIVGLGFEQKTVIVSYVPYGEIGTLNSPHLKSVRLVSTVPVIVFRHSISA